MRKIIVFFFMLVVLSSFTWALFEKNYYSTNFFITNNNISNYTTITGGGSYGYGPWLYNDSNNIYFNITKYIEDNETQNIQFNYDLVGIDVAIRNYILLNNITVTDYIDANSGGGGSVNNTDVRFNNTFINKTLYTEGNITSSQTTIVAYWDSFWGFVLKG